MQRVRRVVDRWARVSDLLLRVRNVGALCFRVVAGRQRARVGHIHKALVIGVISLRSVAEAIRLSVEALVAFEQLQHKCRRVRFDLVDENGHKTERRVVVIVPGLRVSLVISEDRLVLQHLPTECERVKCSLCAIRRQLRAVAEDEVVRSVTIEVAEQASHLETVIFEISILILHYTVYYVRRYLLYFTCTIVHSSYSLNKRVKL